MHFDDRLATVLRFRADGAVTSRIQLRQLLDLLGTMPADARGENVDAAQVRLGALAADIPAAELAAMLDEPAVRLRSPRLVAALAALDPLAAMTALDRAQLTEEEWLDLIPALAPAPRAFVARRRDLGARVDTLMERLGIAANAIAASPEAATAAAQSAAATVVPFPVRDDEPAGIAAIVRKIEAYRKSRAAGENPALLPGNDDPRLPLGEDSVAAAPPAVRAFDFSTDSAGRIIWADPGVAAMVVGLALAAADGDDRLPGGIAEALRRRQPIRAAVLTIEAAPAVSGAWRLDAAPWFEPLSGGFAGYRGRLRRPLAAPDVGPAEQPEDSQPERIRQLLHELRTPVNAIQGFGEIIQQQLFGPVPHEYRALAAGIAGDAARMLAAFEELERLARLESNALTLDSGEADLAAMIGATISQLEAHTRPRGSGFAAQIGSEALRVTLAVAEAERICWRLLATLAGAAAPGEVLALDLHGAGDAAELTVALPAALAARTDETLFDAAAGSVPQAISAGVFGVGFALRLARAEAAAAGGKLQRRGDDLVLVLPGLTPAAVHHSDSAAGQAAG